jgi:hypothetical protein
MLAKGESFKGAHSELLYEAFTDVGSGELFGPLPKKAVL